MYSISHLITTTDSLNNRIEAEVKANGNAVLTPAEKAEAKTARDKVWSPCSQDIVVLLRVNRS